MTAKKQLDFLNRIKDLIPANTSIVQELSELLGISTDSMYRRLRGETSLTFDEIGILCNHFKISFDSFINLESGNVTFNYTVMEDGENSLKNYLTSIRNDLEIVKNTDEKLMIYACEDIPVFHNYYFPEIASFKLLYWMKAILKLPHLEDAKYNSQLVSKDLLSIGKEIYDMYCTIPSIEIWTETSLVSTLKQIEFFWESGLFENKNEALKVCESLYEIIRRIEKQAKEGSKMFDNNRPNAYSDNYSLYFSEIEITNNCVLVNVGNVQSVYLGHHSFNVMRTFNASYCKETEDWLNKIISKSILISNVAEKARYRFFNAMYNSIEELIESIKNS